MCLSVFLGAATLACAQASPPANASINIGGKNLIVRYSAPSVRGRQIFGEGGLLSRDPTYPAWRAGANSATSFHSDANLDIGGLNVPKGDYTLFILPEPKSWQLIVNKQTGQWGLEYHQNQDLGRAPMDLSQSPTAIDAWKMALSSAGGNKATLRSEWEKTIAAIPFTVP